MELAEIETAIKDLSPQDKYRRFRERDRVELKLISKAGAPPKWVGGRIKQNINKGGAYCKVDGTDVERFFHWHDIRPPVDEFDPAKPFVSLSEVARGTLRALPPFLDTEPLPPPAPPAAAEPVSTNQRRALITNEDLRMAEKVDIKPMARAVPLRASASRQESAIGEFLFEERRRRQWNQHDVAKHITGPSPSGQIYNTRVSKIEMGSTQPTDDELLAYAELFKLDLDDLIKLRGEKRKRRSASEIAAAIEAAKAKRGQVEPEEEEDEDDAEEEDNPEPVRGAPLSPTQPRAAGSSTQPALQSMAAFMDAIGSVCPLPLDSKKQKAWLGLVIELYQLNGQESAAPAPARKVKRQIIEQEPQPQHVRGEARAIVLAAADDWSDTRTIKKRCPTLAPGTVDTLLWTLRKEGLLKRRGTKYSFEYRRSRL